MKRKLSIVLTIVMALTVLSVAPVSADGEKPINGKIDLTLYADPCAETGPFVTWIGTVVIDGTTYGWADFPTGPMVPDKKFVYFGEYWTIFTLESAETPTVALACNPALVVLDGTNTGRGSPGAGTYRADGTVGSAADPGPFADVAAGSRMIWRGKVTSFIEDVPHEFKATLHIFPLK
jgi:hypothetical protein